MTGFEVVYNPYPMERWVPVSVSGGASTVYPGQIVTAQASGATFTDGVVPMGVAAGVLDTTNQRVPYGIVLGNNFKAQTANSTYGWQATAVASQANQKAYAKILQEGSTAPKGDPAVMVKIAVLGPGAVIKGKVFEGTYGTAITKYTTTAIAGSGDGSGFTTSAEPGMVDDLAYATTWYCVSGLNKGIYRVSSDTRTTAQVFTLYWPYTVAVGDVFKRFTGRPFGPSLIQFDTLSMYVDNSETTAYGTDSICIDVLDLNLADDGKEYVIFRFNADHYCYARA